MCGKTLAFRWKVVSLEIGAQCGREVGSGILQRSRMTTIRQLGRVRDVGWRLGQTKLDSEASSESRHPSQWFG